MGASQFSGQFNKNPDFFDGQQGEQRDTRTNARPDLYKLLLECGLDWRSATKENADGAAATASPERPFFTANTYIKSVRSVTFLPAAAPGSTDTNFAPLILSIRNADGTLASIIAQATTKTAPSGGTGDWVAFKPVTIPLFDGTNTIGLDSTKLDLAPGQSLTFQIT